jgi:hypothetical protein
MPFKWDSPIEIELINVDWSEKDKADLERRNTKTIQEKYM